MKQPRVCLWLDSLAFHLQRVILKHYRKKKMNEVGRKPPLADTDSQDKQATQMDLSSDFVSRERHVCGLQSWESVAQTQPGKQLVSGRMFS